MNFDKEFRKIKVDDKFCNRNELFSYLDSILYDIKDEESSLKEAIIYNYFYRIRDILSDFINFDFSIDIDFYKKDYLLLKEMILLCEDYKKYLRIIIDSDSNEIDNLYRLGVITNNSFRNNINYFESLRTNLSLMYDGIYFRDSRYIDDRLEFKYFFKEKEKIYGKRY